MLGCFCGCFFHFFSQLTRPFSSLSISLSKPLLICRRFEYDLVIHYNEFNFVTTFDATTIPQFLRNRHLPPISDFPFVFGHIHSYFFHTDIDVGGMAIQFARSSVCAEIDGIEVWLLEFESLHNSVGKLWARS